MTVESEQEPQPHDPWRKPAAGEEPVADAVPSWVGQSKTQNLLAGLMGISVLGAATGLVFPTGAWLARNGGIPDPFAYRILFMLTMLFPTVFVATFAVVAPMFCPGSLLRRVLMTCATLLPGGTIGGYMFWLVDPRAEPYVLPMLYFLLGLFYAAGTVTVLTQMVTRWTLSYARTHGVKTPPFGLGTLIEFTALIAIGCGLYALPIAENYYGPAIVIAIMGGIASFITVRFLIAFLRETRRRRWLDIVVILTITLLISSMLTIGAASAEGSWTWSWKTVSILVPAILYGVLTILAPLGLMTAWLSWCGWYIADRRAPKRTATK